MAGVGGARPGAGRPPGAGAARKNVIYKALDAAGISPLEIMTQLMKKSWDNLMTLEQNALGSEVMTVEERREIAAARRETFDYAQAAAPYCHPRLAQIQSTNKNEDSVVLQITSDDANL